MTLNKNAHGDAKSTSVSDNQPLNLESAVKKLATLLNKCEGDYGKGDDAQVAELLEQLGEADGVAQGVEERLDGIIENLDTLLAELQKKETTGETPAGPDIPEINDKPKSP